MGKNTGEICNEVLTMGKSSESSLVKESINHQMYHVL